MMTWIRAHEDGVPAVAFRTALGHIFTCAFVCVLPLLTLPCGEFLASSMLELLKYPQRTGLADRLEAAGPEFGRGVAGECT